MEGTAIDKQAESTVLSVTLGTRRRLFALASFQIEICVAIELPKFRHAAGLSRSVVALPPEVHGPIGDAVVERGWQNADLMPLGAGAS